MKKHFKTNIPDFFPYNGETCFLLGSCNLNDYLHGGFEVEHRDLFASIVLKKLILKYGRPNCGRNRATFISKKFVLKFPLNDHGEIDNINEYNFKNPNVAKSKLIKINEFSCLMQEKLSIISDIKDFSNFPEWIKLIDSYQIGYDSKNNVKAYDFAEDIEKLKTLL